MMGAQIGTLEVFENEEMDNHLSRHKSTVHEVALVDLLFAARIMGRLPKTRALIAIEPQNLDWGDYPTQAIAAKIPNAVKLVRDLIEKVANYADS